MPAVLRHRLGQSCLRPIVTKRKAIKEYSTMTVEEEPLSPAVKNDN